MKDNITKTKNTILTLISLLSIILLIVSIIIGVYSYNLSTREIKIHATIVKIDYNHVATVEYYVNNKRYEKVMNVDPETELTVNDQVEIIYDKDNPANLINNAYYPIISGIMFIAGVVLFIIFIPKYLEYLKRQKDIKKMKLQGIFIDVPITELVVDNNIKPVKDKHAYRARIKYFNKMSNQEYIYESDPCFVNLSQVIEQNGIHNVKIYFMRENTNNYYVDLDCLIPDIPVVNPDLIMKEKKEEVIEKESTESKPEAEKKE